MNISVVCIALVLSLPLQVRAQDHLEPDVSPFVNPNSYLLKIHQIFEDAFDENVLLRSLVIRSFADEYVVALVVKGEQAEAFVLEPTSNIWLSENLENCRGYVKIHEKAGEKVPPDLLERLKELENKAVDYRTIKAIRRARPIPRPMAEEIRVVWEKMLLDVKYPKNVREPGKDGVTYYYSAWIKDRGEISGNIHQPKLGTKPGALTSLALVLGDYTRGKIELSELQTKLVQTQESMDH